MELRGDDEGVEGDFFLMMFRGDTIAGETGGDVERTIRGDWVSKGRTLGEDSEPIDRGGDRVVMCWGVTTMGTGGVEDVDIVRGGG